MAEYIERVVSNADSCCDGNKIKTHFAQIIVHGNAEKPYYEILYFDTEDRTYHIGFGSYCLDYVFDWLSNEFEIVEAEQEADVARCVMGDGKREPFQEVTQTETKTMVLKIFRLLKGV